MNDKCWGKLLECSGKPVYVAIIQDGPGAEYFNGSVWCEGCMGDSFREGNPYLKKIKGNHER